MKFSKKSAHFGRLDISAEVKLTLNLRSMSAHMIVQLAGFAAGSR